MNSVLSFTAGFLSGMFVKKVIDGGDPARSSSISLGDDDDVDVNAGTYKFTKHDEMKLVFCIRQDLKMTKGKVAAQCCHATVMIMRLMEETYPDALEHWINTGQKKITLKVKDEDEFDTVLGVAMGYNLPTVAVTDAGHTQIPAGSRTVLAIGPAPELLFKDVTSHLKLY